MAPSHRSIAPGVPKKSQHEVYLVYSWCGRGCSIPPTTPACDQTCRDSEFRISWRCGCGGCRRCSPRTWPAPVEDGAQDDRLREGARVMTAGRQGLAAGGGWWCKGARAGSSDSRVQVPGHLISRNNESLPTAIAGPGCRQMGGGSRMGCLRVHRRRLGPGHTAAGTRLGQTRRSGEPAGPESGSSVRGGGKRS